MKKVLGLLTRACAFALPFLIATGVILGPEGARAEGRHDSGNKLLDQCKALIQDGERTSADFFLAGQCAGKIDAVTAAINSIAPEVTGEKDFKVCIPSEVTNGQIGRVVIKSLERNPESLHMDSTGLIALALVLQWPCPKRTRL